MFRRYLPPTSYNAPVMVPKEQTFTVSISSANMFPPHKAVSWSRFRLFPVHSGESP